MDNKFCFLITAYQQVDKTEQNIKNIRENFDKLKDSLIIVVSTSADECGFRDMVQKYDNIAFMHFERAPGNPKNDWYKAHDQEFISWRQKFIPPRVLGSIEVGMSLAYQQGCETVLHIHSDTMCRGSKEDQLLLEIEFVQKNNLLFIGDLSSPCEAVKALPPMMHWNPEGMLLNLVECGTYDYGFEISRETLEYGGGFTKLFNGSETKFRSHNYGSIEALFGQYAVYCLTGDNVLSPTDPVPEIYYQKTRARSSRPPHGDFGFLINPGGEQPNA
jgi:hypothetical protein